MLATSYAIQIVGALTCVSRIKFGQTGAHPTTSFIVNSVEFSSRKDSKPIGFPTTTIASKILFAIRNFIPEIRLRVVEIDPNECNEFTLTPETS